MKPIDEIVKKQMNVIEWLENSDIKNIPGEDISRAIVVLSTNNVFLGEFVAEHDYEINMMEASRKNAWADSYAKQRSSEVKITQKDSEINADQEVKKLVMDEIEAKRSLAKIKNLRMDCKELVSSLQSRLNHLKQERIDASMVPNPR